MDELKTQSVEKFLAELTDLCRAHGIGIAGDALVFRMEPQDHSCDYSMDLSSRLLFGGGLAHQSSCALHNGPAMDAEPCDCGVIRAWGRRR